MLGQLCFARGAVAPGVVVVRESSSTASSSSRHRRPTPHRRRSRQRRRTRRRACAVESFAPPCRFPSRKPREPKARDKSRLRNVRTARRLVSAGERAMFSDAAVMTTPWTYASWPSWRNRFSKPPARCRSAANVRVACGHRCRSRAARCRRPHWVQTTMLAWHGDAMRRQSRASTPRCERQRRRRARAAPRASRDAVTTRARSAAWTSRGRRYAAGRQHWCSRDRIRRRANRCLTPQVSDTLGDRGLAEEHLHLGVEVRRGLHLVLRAERVDLLSLRRRQVGVDR